MRGQPPACGPTIFSTDGRCRRCCGPTHWPILSPLQRLIAAEVTPELLARIAQAHASGRRLYVGSTDLDTKRLVVWDLVRLRPAMIRGSSPFRKVLLASASVPGVLPPVAIDVEVDGRHYTRSCTSMAGSACRSSCNRPCWG